ncbi:MAG: STAS domain-containing protein [Myxococcota bacterium]
MPHTEYDKAFGERIHEQHNAVVLRLRATVVDEFNAKSLSEAYLRIVLQYRRQQFSTIILDLRGVHRMDRWGVQFLLWAWSETGLRLGASLKLVIPAALKRIAQGYFAHHAFAFFDSPDEALRDAHRT